MKPNKLIIRALSVVTGLFCLSFVSGRAVAQQNSSSSVLKFSAMSYDFGKIKEEDGTVSHTFEITNSSSESPYVFDFVSTSCGCTTPDLDESPMRPGESRQITITYNPAGRPGVFQSTVVITGNRRREQHKITLTGEVIGKPRSIEDQFPIALDKNGVVRATSNTLLFGYVPQGTQRSQSFDVYNNGEQAVRIGYRFLNDESPAIFRVELLPAVLQPKQRGQVTVTVDYTEADFWGARDLAMGITIDGIATGKTVTAHSTVTDDFSKLTDEQRANAPKAVFDGQFHHFGKSERNRTLSRDFVMTNTGKSELIIREITPRSEAIGYVLPKRTLAPGESMNIKVTLRTPDEKKRMSENIVLNVNDPAHPVRELRLAANVD